MENVAEHYSRLCERCEALSVALTPAVLWVDLSAQRMELLRDGHSEQTFTISSSRRPPSCIENSLGTPLGLHRIAQKIGADAAPGTVFKGRVSQGHTWPKLTPGQIADNLITSRILWLEGLQEGYNRGPGRDTFSRYIYIHGTNQFSRLGQPNSHGCLLLSDGDVIDLFKRVESGTLVWIEA